MNARGLTPRMAAAALLALLCALQLLALLRMAPAWFPARIELALDPGADIELGANELAAPGAAARALRLGRDGAGRWWAATPQDSPALRFEGGGRRWRSGSVVLRPGMRFQLGALRYRVEASSSREVRLDDGRHRWRYDGATLRRDGLVLPPCPRAGLGARVGGLWNRWAPAPLAFASPLVFGGSLACGTRIGNAHAPAGSATLTLDEGEPRLAASAQPGRAPLLVELEGMPQDLALRATSLEGVDSIGVGRARLRLARHGDSLLLEPIGRVALSPEADIALPPGLVWRWEQHDPWTLPAAALPWTLLALAAGMAGAGLAWHRRRQPWRAARFGAGLAFALLGLGLLLGARAGGAAGPFPVLLLACAALAYGLRQGLGRPAKPVLACGVLLLATGLLLQLELGLGAPDSGWLRHFEKTASLATLGLGLLGCAGSWPGRGARGSLFSQTRTEAALLALAALALAALLAQVGWGDETGVFDLQPVEFAKLALTLLSAHCIALGLGAQAVGDGRTLPWGGLLRWLRLAAPALLFVVLLGVAVVQVDDYSPLVLLLVWGAAMLLAWACATRRRTALVALAVLAGACIGALALARGLDAGEAAQWRFYGDRFGVWLAPAIHPHTGAQLLAGADAIAAGGWLGADGALGLAAPGQGAGAALAIPAVQDDFAPSFLLQRHGLAGALALWTLQALFLGALLGAAHAAWRAAAGARHHREAWFGRWRCFALCGGAAFVFAHFLLSWGTNLAFFPIMGQPMSFLSAGGSHLLFFLFPLLAVGAAGEPSSEEI